MFASSYVAPAPSQGSGASVYTKREVKRQTAFPTSRLPPWLQPPGLWRCLGGGRDRQGLIGGDGPQRCRFAAGPLDEKLIDRVFHSQAEVCLELRFAEIDQSSWMLVE